MQSKSSSSHQTDVSERRAAWPMGHDLRDPTIMDDVVKENLYTPIPSSDASTIFASGLSFVKDGFQDIVEDQFNKCFEPKKDKPWNWTPRLYFFWLIGVFVRYFIFLPVRFSILFFGNVFFAIVFLIMTLFKPSRRLSRIQRWTLRQYGKMWLLSFSAVVKFHGPLPQHKANMIYVSNHTSIIDYMVLCTRAPFGTVGQQHPGILGFLQSKVIACMDNIWFDRSVQQQKNMVSQRIKEHIADPTKARLLIFPEGTCVNNKYCIMFKKGAFEIGATVVPIAIKYHKTFADPFYNSRKMTFWGYCINLMKSWLLFADVYFLEPQTQKEGESVLEFAERVKLLICKAAHLTPTNWDGYLKHYKPSPRFMAEKQKSFSDHIQRQLIVHHPRPSLRIFPPIDISHTPHTSDITGEGREERGVGGGIGSGGGYQMDDATDELSTIHSTDSETTYSDREGDTASMTSIELNPELSTSAFKQVSPPPSSFSSSSSFTTPRTSPPSASPESITSYSFTSPASFSSESPTEQTLDHTPEGIAVEPSPTDASAVVDRTQTQKKQKGKKERRKES